MMKYYLLLIFGFFFIQASGQAPISIERNSELKIELKRNSKEIFSLSLKVDDILSFKAQSEGSVNFKVTDPDGQVIYQSIIKSELVEWQKTVSTEGIYTVEVQSLALLFQTRVSISLSIYRNNFYYGHPSMDTLISKRNKKILVDGEFQIKRNILQAYNYAVQKGDTVLFRFKPVFGVGPYIQIKNDLNELLYSGFSSKGEQFTEISVLETGTYTITMISDAYLPHKSYVKVELISPTRYGELPVINQEAGEVIVDKPKQPYDTIPEVYLDTIIFLGAKRDIINLNKQILRFQFDDPSSIVKWMVFYGSGKEFFDQVHSVSNLFHDQIIAAGATNLLSAYGLGLINKLPKSDDEQVIFTPSSSILYKMKPATKSNYATIDNIYGDHSLIIENKSESSGQKVFIQVVVFRRIKQENQ